MKKNVVEPLKLKLLINNLFLHHNELEKILKKNQIHLNYPEIQFYYKKCIGISKQIIKLKIQQYKNTKGKEKYKKNKEDCINVKRKKNKFSRKSQPRVKKKSNSRIIKDIFRERLSGLIIDHTSCDSDAEVETPYGCSCEIKISEMNEKEIEEYKISSKSKKHILVLRNTKDIEGKMSDDVTKNEVCELMKYVPLMREIIEERNLFGLTGAQFGIFKNFFVTKKKVFFNCSYERGKGGRFQSLECCLTKPKKKVKMKRYKQIKAHYQEWNGENLIDKNEIMNYSGFDSYFSVIQFVTVFQHCTDLLYGITIFNPME